MRRRLAVIAALTVAIAAGIAAAEGPPPERRLAPIDVMLIVDAAEGSALDRAGIDALLAALPRGSRLGAIAYADRATAVRPFGPIRSGDAFRLEEALETVPRGSSAGLADALSLALVEGADALEGAAPRLAILVGGGRIADRIEQVRAEVLPAFAEAGWEIHGIVRGGADRDPLREISAATGGRMIAAEDSRAVADAISLVASAAAEAARADVTAAAAGRAAARARADSWARRLSSRAVASEPPFVPLPAAGLPGLAVALAALIAAFALAARRRPAGASEAIALSERAERATAALREAEDKAAALRLDLQDRGAAGWERARAAREDLDRLVGEIVLALDHLERAIDADGDSPRLAWLREKLVRALAEAGVREIEVAPGDPFDGELHKHVGEAAGDLPRGAVLSVSRKGYAAGADGIGVPRLVRPAEVVVCAGLRASAT